MEFAISSCTLHLTPYADSIRRLVAWLKSQQYEIVLLPISPALGDDAAILKGIVGASATVSSWTDQTAPSDRWVLRDAWPALGSDQRDCYRAPAESLIQPGGAVSEIAVSVGEGASR